MRPCLPSKLVNGTTVQCLGALDKQLLCRTSYISRDISYRFQCSYNGKCLPVSQLCDKKNEEIEFCTQQFVCDTEEIVCALRENENHRVKYFSMHTYSNYPPLETSDATEFNHWPKERTSIRRISGITCGHILLME